MKCIEYSKHIKPSIGVDTKFPFPEELKKHVYNNYIANGKLVKKNIVDELGNLTILIFNNVDTMYEYNTDPVMTEWREAYNAFLVKAGVSTIQGAGYYDITE